MRGALGSDALCGDADGDRCGLQRVRAQRRGGDIRGMARSAGVLDPGTRTATIAKPPFGAMSRPQG